MAASNDYIRRYADWVLEELMGQLPAISIDGARGVGKTETAKRLAHTVLQLDDAIDAETVEINPAMLATAPGPILIDEWQLVPEVWDRVRRLVDSGVQPGHFLLTSSHPPRESPTHSGAGRIVRLRMRPLSMAERHPDRQRVYLSDLFAGQREVSGECSLSLSDYVEEIVASGFPKLRTYTGRDRREALDGYIDHALERDIADLGVTVRRPEALRGWIRAYAAATASTANYQTILDAATSGQPNKPSRITTMTYRDALANMWLLDTVPAWFSPGHEFGGLSQAPKHFLADPALAARLLSLDEEHLLRGARIDTLGPQEGSILGRLFESLVAQSLHTYAHVLEARLTHVRDRHGRHEVDFLLEGPGQTRIAIEVKLAQTVNNDDTKHLHWLKEKLGDGLTDAIIVTTGQSCYRRADGIAVIPFGSLGAQPDIPLGVEPASSK